MRMASSSSANGITVAIGPKISSLAARSVFETGDRNVGGKPVTGTRRRRAADRHAPAVFEIGRDLGPMVGGDQRTHLRLIVEGVADLERQDRCLEQLHEAAERRPL